MANSTRTRRLLVVCALGVAVAVPDAQSKRPVTHEALWLMPRVGAPVPSPDGKWVVFSVVQPAYDEKDQQSDLWIRERSDLGFRHSMRRGRISKPIVPRRPVDNDRRGAAEYSGSTATAYSLGGPEHRRAG